MLGNCVCVGNIFGCCGMLFFCCMVVGIVVCWFIGDVFVMLLVEVCIFINFVNWLLLGVFGVLGVLFFFVVVVVLKLLVCY